MEKTGARTYAAIFLGPQLPHGGFVVRPLQNFKIYYVSAIHVHPFTFPYMVRLNREPGAPGPPVGAPDPLVGPRAPTVARGDSMQRPVMGASGVTSTAAPSAARSYADDYPQLQSA